jgi:AcrR family transcriptional regulator
MAEPADRETRRRAILDAAAAVFDGRGYAATTVEEIAERAGISKGSVYNYFHSKHDLFNHLFTEAVATDEAEADRAVAELIAAADKVRWLLDYWFGRFGHYRRLGRLILEFWVVAAREPQGSELTDVLQGLYDRWLARVTDIVSQGVREGQFRPQMPPYAAASVLTGVLDGLLVHSILNIGVEVDEPFVAALKGAVLAGLGVEPEAASSREARES